MGARPATSQRNGRWESLTRPTGCAAGAVASAVKGERVSSDIWCRCFVGRNICTASRNPASLSPISAGSRTCDDAASRAGGLKEDLSHREISENSGQLCNVVERPRAWKVSHISMEERPYLGGGANRLCGIFGIVVAALAAAVGKPAKLGWGLCPDGRYGEP